MNTMDWHEPYLINFLLDCRYEREFTLIRTPISGDNGVTAMRTEVYEGGKCVLVGVTDMPTSIHDTDEVIDILNSEFELGLY